MALSSAQAERIRELQQRFPFFTQRDLVVLMELDDRDGQERKPQDAKPAK